MATENAPVRNLRRNSLLLVLLIVFVALVIITTLQTQSEPAPDISATQTSEERTVFDNFTLEDIYSVQIRIPGTTGVFTILRVEGDGMFWESVEYGLNIDQNIATAIARTTILMPYQRVVDDIPTARYAEFSLTPGSALMLISIILEDNQQHSLVVGALTPDNSGHYAIVDEREGTYIIDRAPIAFLAAFMRDLYQS